MPHFIEQTIELMRDLPTPIKLIALTLSVVIEYIFPIFPGDTVVLFAGFLNAHAALDLLDISVAIIIGTLIGASISYGLGRLIEKYHHRFRWLSTLIKSDHYRKFSVWYRKWGIWFLLFNRFFPGIRALFFFVAGAEKIHFGKVLLFGGLSALLYNACLVVLGLVLGFKADVIISYFYKFNAIAIIALACVIGGLVFFVWKKNGTK